jgi:metal-dependent hydrolase (beta-lactamase superfamily II)
MEINNKAKVIVSPDAISGKFYSKRSFLHSITTKWPEIPEERLLAIDHSGSIGDGIYIIAHIPHIHPMPEGNQHLFAQDANGQYILDDFRHELALYIGGLLFTGCAHSGLENILAACPLPVNTVVGGFHLLDNHESEAKLTELSHRLAGAYPQTQFYTSHCTGDAAFAILQGVMGDKIHMGLMSQVVNEDNRLWVSFYDGFFGRISVPLFMIVSAFLLLPMKTGMTMSQFYHRRFLCILPPFICFLVLYAVLPAAWGGLTWDYAIEQLKMVPFNFPLWGGHL